MEQLRSAEFKLQNHETTVLSIAEFFNNNTLKKLEALKDRKNVKRDKGQEQLEDSQMY